jgi:hypothetical protein
MLEFDDPAVEAAYARRHAAAAASYDAAAAVMGLVTGVIALVRMVVGTATYPGWVTAWAAASTAKNVAVLAVLASKARPTWLAWRDTTVALLRVDDQAMALIGSAHVLGPMEITSYAPPARVFALTIAFFGSQWPYLCFFALGHPLRARVAAPVTFAILLLLVAAAPHNYDRLASVRGGAINANPYVQALAHAATVAVRAGGGAHSPPPLSPQNKRSSPSGGPCCWPPSGCSPPCSAARKRPTGPPSLPTWPAPRPRRRRRPTRSRHRSRRPCGTASRRARGCLECARCC